MTNKLVGIINILKVPKIKKILLYEMKFLVPNYSCLQNPWLGGYCPQLLPPDPRSLCPVSSTEFVDPPPKKKFLGTPLNHTVYFYCLQYYVNSRQLLPPYLLVIYQLCGHDTRQREAAGRDKTIGGLQCTNNLKVRVKFTLERATKAQRGRRGIVLLFL